jgi:DNA-binding NarL/FixJ family response regulator
MEQNQKIRIVLTDDHSIVRDGIRMLLAGDEEIEVVGQAANGQELLALLENTPADLVLLDINMPIMDGFEAARQVTARFPDTKVLGLSMLEEEPVLRKMMEAGAAGFLPKTGSKQELVAAIKLVVGEAQYISADLSLKLLHSSPDLATAQPEGNGLLSRRELEVLGLIAEGYTNAEIAARLFNSKRTIETHRQNILEKTKARNTASLIKYAIQHGYLHLDPKPLELPQPLFPKEAEGLPPIRQSK